MSTLLLYALALGLLGLSHLRDPERTRASVRKAVASFMNILPDFLVVLGLVGIMLTFLSPSIISQLLGTGSGPIGLFLASVLGAVTLIPGFVAFPLAASLLERGAGPTQIALFISTLMMVGIVTFPLERRYFGRREALLRNGFAYVYSFLAAGIVGWMVLR
jgi:uncharacterized membrane protein YraQ (UPF0718 family)